MLTGIGGDGLKGAREGKNLYKIATKQMDNVGKSKWWHPNYVDNLNEVQTILGIKQIDKGLATLGSATEEIALNTGKSWVGEGYKIITDNG